LIDQYLSTLSIRNGMVIKEGKTCFTGFRGGCKQVNLEWGLNFGIS
jgi:hypothetical protein